MARRLHNDGMNFKSPFSLHRRSSRGWHWLAGAVLCGVGVSVAAQSAAEAVDWRKANEAVGQFKRGHIDLLKWEAAHPSAPSASPNSDAAPMPTLRLDSAADAVRLAWQTHPDLARITQRVGATVADQVAQGQWQALDVRWQRRLHEINEWVSVAVQTRKAWLSAVAARQTLPHHQTALNAAQAAHALGERMVAVGNWSTLQHSRTQLALIEARMNHRRAQWAVTQADAALHQLLGLRGPHTLDVPSTLPDLPASLPDATQRQTRLLALQDQVSWRQAQQLAALAPVWWASTAASHAQAQDSRELLRVRQHITEQTQLHYNGMLKSTWDVLSEAIAQARAGADAVAALQQFWLLEADWQALLQGQIPDKLPTLGADSNAASASATAGH